MISGTGVSQGGGLVYNPSNLNSNCEHLNDGLYFEYAACEYLHAIQKFLCLCTSAQLITQLTHIRHGQWRESWAYLKCCLHSIILQIIFPDCQSTNISFLQYVFLSVVSISQSFMQPIILPWGSLWDDCNLVLIAVGQDAALVSAELLCCRQILAEGWTAGLTHSQEKPPRFYR